MGESIEKVLVAYFEPHVYVRVGPGFDDVGRKFLHSDEPLIHTIRTAVSGRRRGTILDQRLYVVFAPDRTPVVATAIFGQIVKLPQYQCKLGDRTYERPGQMVFCAANRTLRDLQRIATNIQQQISGTTVTVTWPCLTIRYRPKDNTDFDIEMAACAELNLPHERRNTLWNLRL